MAVESVRRLKGKERQHPGGPRNAVGVAGAEPPTQSALLQDAIARIAAMSPASQDAIAGRILADLQAEIDPTTARFQQLIEAKYTRGLSIKEKRELQMLESAMDDADEAFYRPILDRARESAARSVKKRRPA